MSGCKNCWPVIDSTAASFADSYSRFLESLMDVCAPPALGACVDGRQVGRLRSVNHRRRGAGGAVQGSTPVLLLLQKTNLCGVKERKAVLLRLTSEGKAEANRIIAAAQRQQQNAHFLCRCLWICCCSTGQLGHVQGSSKCLSVVAVHAIHPYLRIT